MVLTASTRERPPTALRASRKNCCSADSGRQPAKSRVNPTEPNAWIIGFMLRRSINRRPAQPDEIGLTTWRSLGHNTRRMICMVRPADPVVHIGGRGMTFVRRSFVLAGLALLLGASIAQAQTTGSITG